MDYEILNPDTYQTYQTNSLPSQNEYIDLFQVDDDEILNDNPLLTLLKPFTFRHQYING